MYCDFVAVTWLVNFDFKGMYFCLVALQFPASVLFSFLKRFAHSSSAANRTCNVMSWSRVNWSRPSASSGSSSSSQPTDQSHYHSHHTVVCRQAVLVKAAHYLSLSATAAAAVTTHLTDPAWQQNMMIAQTLPSRMSLTAIKHSNTVTPDAWNGRPTPCKPSPLENLLYFRQTARACITGGENNLTSWGPRPWVRCSRPLKNPATSLDGLLSQICLLWDKR